MELLFPASPSSSSSPITSKSGPAVAAPCIAICGSRIRSRNGGSSMADSMSCGLIVVVMTDPVSRWHHIMVVDHDRGRRLMMDPNKRQWTMTVDYSGSDLDDGSLSCWLLTMNQLFSILLFVQPHLLRPQPTSSTLSLPSFCSPLPHSTPASPN
ncbi:unnamed protein product [Pleuronectes platessa]|uniref:Uncharacterized protein n=1 Tax=Pleuronectes platessa TaxID=8262 RepID=A0A9N7UMT3_PLEPL|nr:unnamed protein product [Pleuronectes platessa]